MDGQQFDKLTRVFASGIDRRSLLKVFGGATAAGVAGMTIGRAGNVFAQDCPGDGTPGACCLTDDDCDGTFCVIQGDVGAEGICACTESGLGDPWLGCDCHTGTQTPCGDSDNICCATGTTAGGPGVCQSECDPVVECDALQTMCESSGCCAEDTQCGANGWCYGCYSGTEDPCGPYNEAFGADYICCTYGDTTPGAVGYCVASDECVVAPPNTGAGTTEDATNWIAPAAAVGAAAAVIAYRSREQKADTEA